MHNNSSEDNELCCGGKVKVCIISGTGDSRFYAFCECGQQLGMARDNDREGISYLVSLERRSNKNRDQPIPSI